VSGPCLGKTSTGIVIFEASYEETARHIIVGEPVTLAVGAHRVVVVAVVVAVPGQVATLLRWSRIIRAVAQRHKRLPPPSRVLALTDAHIADIFVRVDRCGRPPGA
jgi:hypothetical protein